ncbi:MAG: apolipoprotein N-acyltransferase [Verrucomicrobiota bacterium]
MKRLFARLIAATATGVSMALTLPPYDLGGLVWLVLVPLLIALWSLTGKRSGRVGFALGWLAGGVYFLISLHWISVVSGVGWVLLSLYLGGFIGVWGAFAAKWANPWRVRESEGSPIERRIREKTTSEESHWRKSMRSLRIAFSVAALWCGLEWLRGWLFTGFGWNPLATAFHDTPVMAQSADLIGLCGLSFVPLFLQAVVVQTGRRLFEEARAGKLRPRIDFGVAALLIALCFCYGVWRLQSVGKGESVRLKALLVQLNIPQDAARRLWTPEDIHLGYEDETKLGLERVAREDEQRFRDAEEGDEVELRRPDWVMWPESSLTGRLLMADDGRWATYQENLITMERVWDEGDFELVMGLNEIEGEFMGDAPVMKSEARVWNSLTIFDPEGGVESYRKKHLVIFGEYIPLVESLPFLKRIYEQQSGAEFGGSFSRGESVEPMMVEIDGEQVGLIPTVCFEDTVPRLMRKFVRGGPQLIVNVTNDGWFKESPAAAQHYANCKFRAIELRRPMLRCANSGVSAAVTPTGTSAHPDTGKPQEIRDENGSHFTRGSMLAEVEIPMQPTLSLYALIGDWGVILLGVAGVVSGLRGRRRA